jgi:osmotically-inducible protein OsmY
MKGDVAMKRTKSRESRKRGQTGLAKGRSLLLAPVMAVLLLGLAACDSPEAELEKEATDKEITNAIRSELWFHDGVDANDVDVITVEGIVTLSGTVDNILAEERAVKIAETTVGVRGIVNRIQVEPAGSRSDARLETAVRTGLVVNPATEAFDIKVEADDGVITLTGTVESWYEKQLATTVAKGIKGVRDIRNKLRLKYEADRSDREIREEVEARLENDVLIDDALISVKVDDGKVRLSGTVGSLGEKTRARTFAWVTGVKDVEAAELGIEWWMRDKMRRKSSYTGRADREIESALMDALLYDPRVSARGLDITVDGGAVTLTGVVEDLQAREAAGEDARHVTGVWRVKNYLKVRPETIPSNEELEERVGMVLREDPYLERWKLDIQVSSGWVYLYGKVDTSWEKHHAEHKASRVKGVVRVINGIQSDYKWKYKPDWEIREDINDQLFWSPFVDEDNVRVTVEDGVATLTGNVETWGERGAAENNAYEGGAKDVKNKLTVTHRTLGPYDGFTWYPPLYPG